MKLISLIMSEDHEHIRKTIIDKLSDENWFFAHLYPFIVTVNDDVLPTYKYYRVKHASAVAREFYSEVPENLVEQKSVETNIATLAFAISMEDDLMNIESPVNQWNMQMKFAVTKISDLFNEMVIRGNSAVPAKKDDPAVGPATFDGLDKIIHEELFHVWETPLDLTGLDLMVVDDKTKQTKTNVWQGVFDKMMARLRELSPKPTFILGNYDLISALSDLGRRTGTYQRQQNDFGDIIEQINGISLIPMGKRCGYNEEIIPLRKTNTPCRENPSGKNGETFETTAYVGSFGKTAIMGLKLPGELVSISMSDIKMHIGMAVMSSHACGMFTHVCIPESLIE